MAWKWYVYQFFDHETCVYVGKGSGRRFQTQSGRFKQFAGYITAFFKTEEDALSHERALILALAPNLNKALHPGQPEPWKHSLLPIGDNHKDFYAWCDHIGTRQMALRILLGKGEAQLRQFGIDFRDLLSRLEPRCPVG